MTRPRLWLALVLLGAGLGEPAAAQQTGGGAPAASGGGGGSGAGSGRGTGSGSGSGNAPAPAEDGAASAFGSPAAPAAKPAPRPSDGAVPGGVNPAMPESGASPTPGAGPTRDSDLPESAATFNVPGVLGRPTESFTAGQGRLSRPRFRFLSSFSVGFDDNVFGTPTEQQQFPEQRFTVLVRPEQEVLVRDGSEVRFVNGIQQRVPTFRVERQPAVTEEVVIPGPETQPREPSLIAQANVGLQVQFASRRTLFTLDGRLGAEYVPARDVDPVIYSGSLGVRFVEKLTPRLQWTASIDGAYTQQPDFSRANTPTAVTIGNFLDLVARTGLSYRWTPRLSTSGSLTYRTIVFTDKSEQNADFNAFTYSFEGRYLTSPRFTALAEMRYETIGYSNSIARDSGTSFFLAGGDWIISRRLNTSFRTGVTIRANDLAGTQASPYLQMNIGYRLPRASQIQWTSIYGFEEPPDASSKAVTFRNGLSYAQYFTPRLRAVASSNIVYSTITNRLTDLSFTQLAFDLNLGLEYNINRRWTFNGTYSYSTIFSNNEFIDFYRNRFLLGFQYAF